MPKRSFWRYASLKFLRGIGGCIAFISIFYGLIEYGDHHTDGVILATFLFICGLLLTWYASFKIHER